MKKAAIALAAIGIVFLLYALTTDSWNYGEQSNPTEGTVPAILPSTPASESDKGFLYGRITTKEGNTYEGRLRWGGDEEAFWGDYFNGSKDGNSWAAHVPADQLRHPRPIDVFGVEIASRQRKIDLDRPFMSRFGDIARIEARGRDILVTLKDQTVFGIERLAADDLADGLRVWDPRYGVLDFGESRIRMVEFLPTKHLEDTPDRLHGTVQTQQGDFTGFIQWDREECIGSDELEGNTPDGELTLRFDSIRSIARNTGGGSLVTLADESEVMLTGNSKVGPGNRGVYVDDSRYGRVLISWEAFERLDFSPGGNGPGYDDFPPGGPITGQVATRDGRRLSGRLIYDLDESRITETLDAPLHGVDYTIPFGMIAAIARPGNDTPSARHTRVRLHNGEALDLEHAGDFSERNAGMLIFENDGELPEYVMWADVDTVVFDRPEAMYPSSSER